MDCKINNCHLYDKDCFFQTILVRQPDPKTGCSYYRRIKKGKFELKEDEIISENPKKKKVGAKRGRKKKENNSLQEIM
jgi:hypothetical protein